MKENLLAAARDGNNQTIEMLLQQGIDVNASSLNGSTALIWAAHHGKLDTIKLLISHGANLDIRDDFGNTALHWAAQNKHDDIVKLLLMHGADPTIKNNNQLTVVEFASIYNNHRAQELESIIQKRAQQIAQLQRQELKLASVEAESDVEKINQFSL